MEGKRVRTHVVDLLFQLGPGLGQDVDLVLLHLQVVQGLLVGLLQGLLLLAQLPQALLLVGHLLAQVFNLSAENRHKRVTVYSFRLLLLFYYIIIIAGYYTYKS